ncbi:MAG: HD-GYP domain-containing protein [Caldilineaceae bacterium]|nr:HD-GYP domain-containing protein [Caldilineaceae bacterium]
MSTASMIDGVLPKERDRTHLVPYYTSFISLCGVLVASFAMIHYDSEWGILALFSVAAIVAELTSVQLFSSSGNRISIAAVITTAAIAVLGPWGGALTGLASGVATVITTSKLFKQFDQQRKRAVWWRRLAFNMSLRVLGPACGGMIYVSFFAGNPPVAIVNMWTIFPLLVAVITDEFVTVVLLSIAINFQSGRKFKDIWQTDLKWAYPITVASSVIGGGGLAFAYESTGFIGVCIFMLPVAATAYALHLYVDHTRSYVDQLEEANQQLEESNLGLLQTLAAVIDAYDIYTFGHSAQVARYAEAIADAMGLSQMEQTQIMRGGLIHDIGKVGVTDAIIGKKGRLTDEEYAALKLHTVIGAEIVSQMPQLQDLVPLVRNHHERWDGRGYPDGLKGEENTLGARIMCLADSVEAMLSDRPYQSTRSLNDVIEEVKRCSGAQFDPQVVDAFLEVTEKHGSEFFINSASRVARELEKSGAFDSLDGICYAKKSMIALHLRKANSR